MVADAALGQPTHGWMVHSACQGVVVHCDLFVMWGISQEADDHLRALAVRAGRVPGESGRLPGALEVPRAVLGMPLDHAGGRVVHAHAPMPEPTPRPAPGPMTAMRAITSAPSTPVPMT